MSLYSGTIAGYWPDWQTRRLRPAEVTLEQGFIASIKYVDSAPEAWILPGFIDAHIHIESSMLTPGHFAHMAVRHGTVATISDPHEIANVLGIPGVDYMIRDGHGVPFSFFFGAPSCVPATPFETAGAVLGAAEVAALLDREEVIYLAEMMNFPGVIHHDPLVMAKIAEAHKRGKPVDGHAPAVSGDALKTYVGAGISTDHECVTLEEAREKMALGMKILIREGSAARNFDALWPLLNTHPDMCMLCSDDKHPDDLMHGHINRLAARALANGVDVFHILQAACINPIDHYHLSIGKPEVGQKANLTLVKPETFDVFETWVEGHRVFSHGEVLFTVEPPRIVNTFYTGNAANPDFSIPAEAGPLRVIHALNGQLITKGFTTPPNVIQGKAEADVERDILKIAVINRYEAADPALGFISGFGLKKGAIASTVGHDCHNLLVVGTNDRAMAELAKALSACGGGIGLHDGEHLEILPLPIAGLMSDQPGEIIGKAYERLSDRVKHELGSPLDAPFMTLSFMALLVIPEWKLGDKGLFQTSSFSFQSIWAST